MEESQSHSGTLAVGFIRMLTSNWTSRALYTAAKLDVAEAMHRLGGTNVSVHALSEQVGAPASALRRLLRALASVAVFRTEGEPHGWCFSLTPLGNLLRSGAPGSLRNAAIMYGEEMTRCWSELPSVVHDERPAWARVCGAEHFEYYQRNPDAAKIFDEAMRELGSSIYNDAALAASYDFERYLGKTPHIVDLGGGLGGFLMTILDRVAGARGTLFDRPHVIQRATERHTGASRMALEQGDFFESVPCGADVYVLKRILHDWDDARCQIILSKIAEVMNPSGRVLVAETVLPTGDEDHFGKWLDLNMMVVTGGQERTKREFATLFERAGLELVECHVSPTLLCIIEARRKHRAYDAE